MVRGDQRNDELGELRGRLAAVESQNGGDWLRGAKEIGAYIGSSPKRVHNLVSTGQLQVERDGQAYLVTRSTLDQFVMNGGGKSP